MYRALLVFGVALLGTGGAVANVPPMKAIPVEYTITTDKEYPDYVFFLLALDDTKTVTAVKFDPKNPIEIKPGKFSGVLVAVPKGTEKNFADAEDFRKSLRKEGGIEGRVQANVHFNSTERVLKADKRNVIVLEYKVKKIDAKKGIIVLVAKKDGEKEDAPDDEDTLSTATRTPRGGVWIAGVAASLAVMLGGLWLTGRTRRKV